MKEEIQMSNEKNWGVTNKYCSANWLVKPM